MLRQTRADGVGFEIAEKLAKALCIEKTGIETGGPIDGSHAQVGSEMVDVLDAKQGSNHDPGRIPIQDNANSGSACRA